MALHPPDVSDEHTRAFSYVCFISNFNHPSIIKIQMNQLFQIHRLYIYINTRSDFTVTIMTIWQIFLIQFFVWCLQANKQQA